MSGFASASALQGHRVVPVVVIRELDSVPPLAEALDRGGLPIAEVTFRTEAAAEAIRLLAADRRILVGAGTLVRPEQVDIAVDAGARFVVTPGFSARVVERCRQLGVPVIPGVSTPTEASRARRGPRLAQVLPCRGDRWRRLPPLVSAPFPCVRSIPTGGMSAANAASYLALPSVVAVGGSWMVAPELLAARDFESIERLARAAVVLGAESET